MINFRADLSSWAFNQLEKMGMRVVAKTTCLMAPPPFGVLDNHNIVFDVVCVNPKALNKSYKEGQELWCVVDMTFGMRFGIYSKAINKTAPFLSRREAQDFALFPKPDDGTGTIVTDWF